MNRILVKPAKRIFGGRNQWKFELRAANGERIDPRDTFGNRDEASEKILAFRNEPVELVIYDKGGNVESRTELA